MEGQNRKNGAGIQYRVSPFKANRAPIIKPSRLMPGDQVGVISPSGPVSESDLLPGLNLLESAGFKVRLAPHVYDRQGYLAGNDKDRLSDFHSMFRNPDVKAVFCARGGYGSLRLLDEIDYTLILENPKIFVGYSDITALLMAIYAKTGLITFHGPVVRDFATKDQENWNNLIKVLSSGDVQKFCLREEGPPLIHEKTAGPLIGGNLSLICHLIGTPFLPSLDGCIMFLEEKGESLYRLDRMLTHLSLAGQLKRLSGLIGGEFEQCGERSSINRLLMRFSQGLNIPLATGLRSGHGMKNLTLPIGLTSELDTNLMTLSITEACTVERKTRS